MELRLTWIQGGRKKTQKIREASPLQVETVLFNVPEISAQNRIIIVNWISAQNIVLIVV